MQPSPPYASESNGAAERIVQEHWTWARVLMFASELPQELWGEALKHANCLRNRLPSSRVNNQFPIVLWSPQTEISFSNLPVFGQPGFLSVYRSKNAQGKKMLPRSEFSSFVGMESDVRLIRVYVPAANIKVVRRADFKPIKGNSLPSLSALIDGLSRQHSIEAANNTEGQAEAHLVKIITEVHLEYPALAFPFQKYPQHDEPTSFDEACQSQEWASAIDREYGALIERGTWQYVSRTPDMHVIKFKWTFKKKIIDPDAEPYLCKARCVARGDLQHAYLDYDPDALYAPVAAHHSIRCLIAFTASHGLVLEGGDVANEYLYGAIDTPVFMEQPLNSSNQERRPGMVCMLRKSIYEIKQAGHIWGSTLHSALASRGFKTSRFDHRLYMLRHNKHFIVLAIVVDDIAMNSNNNAFLDSFKHRLAATFDVKLFGPLRSFIGRTIVRSQSGIHLNQASYASQLLRKYGMHNANSVHTPLPLQLNILAALPNESLLSPSDHAVFRAVVGGLLYLAVCRRPDMAFSVGALARHMHAPTARHLMLFKRVLRYLAGTRWHGLHFGRHGTLTPQSLHATVDADWGGDRDTRKSTTGYVVVVNGTPVFWKSRLQTVIALSSGESEYVALSNCARDVTWVRKLFAEICTQQPWAEDRVLQPTVVLSDSQAAASLARNDVLSGRTKHIDLKIHHVKELVALQVIALHYVPSSEQCADILAKSVDASTMFRLRDKMRVVQFQTAVNP